MSIASDMIDNLSNISETINTMVKTGTITYGALFTGVISILYIIAMWKIFNKAGEKGWKSLIPIYNIAVFYKIAGLSPWLLLLYIIPFVNAIAAVIIAIVHPIKLAKAFGKSTGFGILTIFFSTICYLILGLGNAEYVGTEK